MSDDDILDHLGLLKGGYVSGGISGGPFERYRTTYIVGKSCNITIVRNHTNLIEVTFWDKNTGKGTTTEISESSNSQ